MKRALVILLATAGYYSVIPFVISLLPIDTGVNVGFSIGAAAIFFLAWFFGAGFAVAAIIGFGKVAWRDRILRSKSRAYVQVQNPPMTIIPRDVRSDAVFIGLIGAYSIYQFAGMVMRSLRPPVPMPSRDIAELLSIAVMSAPFAVIGIVFSAMAVKGYKSWPTTKQLLAELDKTRCRQCGCNLFGLPEKRCPECGTSFEQSPPEKPMNLTEHQSL